MSGARATPAPETPRRPGQWLVLGLLIAAVVLVVVLLMGVIGDRSGARTEAAPTPVVSETLWSGLTNSRDVEESWIRRMERESARRDEELRALRLANEALQTELASDRAERKEIFDGYDALVRDLAVQVEKANGANRGRAVSEQRLAALGDPTSVVAAPGGAATGGDELGEFVAGGGRTSPPVARPGGAAAFDPEPSAERPPAPPTAAFSVSFDLSDQTGGSHSLEDYVPAGSYAPAVVISGVDASVGVDTQSDPRPVLLRVTGPAVTASHAEVDLTGCMVSGSAIGDLSAERIFVRFVSMTCERGPGRVVEARIEGYVSGRGKAGVRGLVVSREGEFVSAAAVAGALSGLAQGVSEIGSVGTTDSSIAEGLNPGAIAQSVGLGSAGNAVSGAAERLSDYYISRAEQYQPVVSLYAGTKVEIVFQRGASLRRSR